MRKVFWQMMVSLDGFMEARAMRLVKDNVAEEITRLKQQPGKDLAIFGSADLASSFMRLGLIDEIRTFVNPVVLGVENPMFKNIESRANLKLLRTETMSSGVVILYHDCSLKER